jgi:hypothetical protein
MKRKTRKASCLRTPGTSWVRGKRGSRVGYCRKIRRRSRTGKKTRSGKKMRRGSCKLTFSGKKRTRKGCKLKSKCSWRKGSKGKKGMCVKR